MRLFLDSSILFALADSPLGASRELLTVAFGAMVELVASEYVFDEVIASLGRKNKEAALPYVQGLRRLGIFDLVYVTEHEVRDAGMVVTDPDDAAIVAGAKKARVNALVSFDRKHLHTHAVRLYIGAPVLTAGEALMLLRSA